MDESAVDTEDRVYKSILVKRLLMVVLPVLAVPAVMYLLSEFLIANDYRSIVLFGVSFLVFVPFAVSLIVGALYRRFYKKQGKSERVDFWGRVVLAVITLILVLGSPFLICGIIAAPYMLIGIVGGVIASGWMVKLSTDKQALAALVAVFLIPFGMAGELHFLFDESEYTIQRSVVVQASSDEIWPHLHRIDSVSDEEGVWNFSQDVLAVPRPVEAIVVGEGVGAVRTGVWENDIWFEEHITHWRPGQLIEWDFVFPEGSRITAIDQHIDPRGPAVFVEHGGYELRPISHNETELRLFTRFKANTSFNGYGKLWGEIILGDVQTNILSIVKTRAERAPGTEPDDAGPLLVAGKATTGVNDD